MLLTRGVVAEAVPDVLMRSQMYWCAERDAQKHQRSPEESGGAQGRVNPTPATTATHWVDVPSKPKQNTKLIQKKNVGFLFSDPFSIRKEFDHPTGT